MARIVVIEVHLGRLHFFGGFVFWCEVHNLLYCGRLPEIDSAENNNLAKHQSKCICIVDGVPSSMKVGDVYITTNYRDTKAWKIWAGKKLASMVKQVVSNLAREYKLKEVQFATLFEILSHGLSMVDYEQFEVLLKHLRVKNMSAKH